jgi:hypothetical protein
LIRFNILLFFDRFFRWIVVVERTCGQCAIRYFFKELNTVPVPFLRNRAIIILEHGNLAKWVLHALTALAGMSCEFKMGIPDGEIMRGEGVDRNKNPSSVAAKRATTSNPYTQHPITTRELNDRFRADHRRPTITEPPPTTETTTTYIPSLDFE